MRLGQAERLYVDATIIVTTPRSAAGPGPRSTTAIIRPIGTPDTQI
jgi:hypothetical protein